MHYSTARMAWTIVLGLILILILVEAIRLVILYRSVKGYKTYWAQQASAPANQHDFIYVALGDSVAQGIGASNPHKGYVSLIAQHIEQTTGRHVHIINVSVTGATAADVVREQLPKIKGLNPDLVTLDIGANDVSKRVPMEAFERDFTAILDALPARKAIVADIPSFSRGHKQSEFITRNLPIRRDIERHGFQLAPVYDFTRVTLYDITTYGADFFHPNDKGYRNWYNAFQTKLDGVINDQASGQ